MSADKCFLAIDLGASSGRIMAGLLGPGGIRIEELHRFGNGPVTVADSLRWDVIRLWSEIQIGLTKAADRFGDQIVSIGVDTWGVDYVLLSKSGEILGQPHHYRDSRTHGLMESTFGRVPREEIFATTGLQFMEINTLYQLIAGYQRHPELMDLTQTFLMMPDFFHWLLCGSRVVEFTNATTTQCLDAKTGTWAFDMLRKLQLPTQMFPEVIHPGTVLGKLRESVAKRAGLPRLNVVAPATHDTGAAIAAVPTELSGTTRWAYISSGTWSLMGVESPHAILNEKALALNVTNEGGIDGTYRVLKNIMGMWLIQECRRSFERSSQSFDYGSLNQLAADAPAFRAFVNPDAGDFLAPSDMPTAIQQFCKKSRQEIPETEGEIIRCCLESLALRYRQILTRLEDLTGTRVEVIHIVGGGSQNDLLNQFTANACGRPVVAGPVEATALGNVLIQARSAGELTSLDEIRSVVRKSASVTRFEPQQQSAWDDAYERFSDLAE